MTTDNPPGASIARPDAMIDWTDPDTWTKAGKTVTILTAALAALKKTFSTKRGGHNRDQKLADDIDRLERIVGELIDIVGKGFNDSHTLAGQTNDSYHKHFNDLIAAYGAGFTDVANITKSLGDTVTNMSQRIAALEDAVKARPARPSKASKTRGRRKKPK
jgi:hypothetical protein